MATYDYYKEFASPSEGPKTGSFILYCRLDFAKQNMAANDVCRLAKLKAGWIIRDSYYRMPGTASTSTATMDLGTTADGTGQEIAAGIDLDAIGNAVWNQGVIDCDGTTESVDADSYLTAECLGAAASTGVLEVMLEILAAPVDTEPADADIS
jgi:hypothetical protein